VGLYSAVYAVSAWEGGLKGSMLMIPRYWNRNARCLLFGVWLSLIFHWHPTHPNNQSHCSARKLPHNVTLSTFLQQEEGT
jgi:hypothetical protein